MSEPNPVLNFLIDMATRLPLVLIWVVGMVFAILRWNRHPRASLLMLIGLVLFLIGTTASSLAHHLVIHHLITNDASSHTIQQTLLPIQLTGALVHVAGWILVLVGAFGAAGAQPNAAQLVTDAQHHEHLSDDRLEALRRIVPVSSSTYTATLGVSFGLSLVLVLISSILTFVADQPGVGGGVACFSMIGVIVGMVVMGVFIHRIWAAIQMGQPRTTPGKAVGFLFIPFFSLYWIFQAYWGWAKDYNSLVAELNIDAPPMPERLPLSLCVFMLAAMPIGFIPFVGPLVSIVGLVLLLTFVAKAARAVQALVDAGQRIEEAPPANDTV